MYDFLSSDFFSDVQNPLPGEDFGAVLVTTSTTVSSDTSEPTFTTSSRHRKNTINRVSVPTAIPSPPATLELVHAPTPVPTSAPPSTPNLSHGPFPLIISSQNNIGFPNYTYHPSFVRPGLFCILCMIRELNSGHLH